MREQLIQLAKKLGFNSIFLSINILKRSEKSSLKYYLWMCELQKWIRDKHNIHVNINPRFHERKLGNVVFYAFEISTKDNDYDGLGDNLNQWLQDDLEFHICSSPEEALEQALYQVLLIISPTENNT